MTKFSPQELANISRCAAFAALAHKGQSRYKNSNGGGKVPYIVHPARVATLVACFGGSDLAVMAAWLHDVKEDCPGVNVAEFIESLRLGDMGAMMLYGYVLALTKDATLPSRMERLENHLESIELWQEAVLVKICDRIDNLTITEYEDNQKKIEGMDGKEFVRMYIKESEFLLKRLKSKAKLYEYMPAWETLRDIIEEWKKNGVVAVPNHNP
jgi:(p)ppGpp synthase/HD superfamily hydrolase